MKILRHFLLFFITCLLAISIQTYAQQTELIESRIDYYEYFDTSITIRVWDSKAYSDGDPLWTDIENIIKDIQYTFKRTAPEANEQESELYRLNKSAGNGVPFKVSDDLYEVLKIGLRYAEITNGKFDPTIGPLVDLWNINNPDDSHPAPKQEEINALLPLVDYTLVQMDDENKTVYLPLKGMIVDLGAIAKGYAADKLADYMRSKNVNHAMIYLGGNIMAVGSRHTPQKNGTYTWGIGIKDPREFMSKEFSAVFVEDKSVVTSGIYERYIIDPDTDKFYHHIIDPDTGYPVENNLTSVTIITDSSTTADCFSTSVFLLGIENGIKFVENFSEEDVEAVLVTNELEIYNTSGVKSKYDFQLYNTDYKVVNQTQSTNIWLIVGGSVGIIIIVGGTILIVNRLLKRKYNN